MPGATPRAEPSLCTEVDDTWVTDRSGPAAPLIAAVPLPTSWWSGWATPATPTGGATTVSTTTTVSTMDITGAGAWLLLVVPEQAAAASIDAGMCANLREILITISLKRRDYRGPDSAPHDRGR